MRISDWSSDVCSSDLINGYLSLGLLQLSTPDFLEREVFICGPEPYMQSVKGMLGDAGFPMDRFHQESFSFETMLDAQAAVEEAAQIEQADDASALADIQRYSVQLQRSEERRVGQECVSRGSYRGSTTNKKIK